MVVVTFLPVLGSFTEIVLTSYVLQSVSKDVTLHASAHCGGGGSEDGHGSR